MTGKQDDRKTETTGKQRQENGDDGKTDDGKTDDGKTDDGKTERENRRRENRQRENRCQENREREIGDNGKFETTGKQTTRKWRRVENKDGKMEMT